MHAFYNNGDRLFNLNYGEINRSIPVGGGACESERQLLALGKTDLVLIARDISLVLLYYSCAVKRPLDRAAGREGACTLARIS